MSHPSIRLVARDLSKRFGSRLLFQNLSLEMQGGQSLAIGGANGSGKSTLLKILGGLLAPTRGHVRLSLGDDTIGRTEHPLQVGIVAPYVNLYAALTARENLLFLARLRDLPTREERVSAMLKDVGLVGRADEPVSTFSSGMLQRLRMAAACLPAPALLLLDEPSVTLDQAGIALVDHMIAAQVRQGGVVILATNIADEAARCQRHLEL